VRNKKDTARQKTHRRRRIPAVAAGAAAIYAGTGTINDAAAEIIHFNGPLSITINGPDVEWDVDGDGEFDFVLQSTASFSTSKGLQYTYRYLMLNSHDGRNGRGFVQVAPTPPPPPGTPRPPDEDIQNLPAGFVVGPTLPSAYRWGISAADFRSMMYFYNGPTYRSVSVGFAAVDFEDRIDGFAGFRFENASGIHYGWAKVNLDLETITLSVREWAYESTPGAAIAVGAVPEPGTLPLTLFAAGAAGVALWRRRKRAEQEHEPSCEAR
jgi:hypothetical protein